MTCVHGTNRLVPPRRDVILAAARRALERPSLARPVIERWDGRAAERIVRVVCDDERFDAEDPGRVKDFAIPMADPVLLEYAAF